MNRTITSLIFVCVFAPCAEAADGVAATSFTTGTSFENRDAGLFDYTRDDKGGQYGDKYWATAADTNGMKVVAYGAGEAYDYGKMGTRRNALFDQEPDEAKGTPGENAQYLGLDVEEALERSILAIEDETMPDVPVEAGVYGDTLARFTTSHSAPAVSNVDRIAVWLRERERGDGTVVTNLMITAGYYAGGFGKVEARDYALTNAVAEGAWCRLTIRAISNITARADWNTPGFEVYIDGKPAAGGADYAIGADYREDWLTPEARMLRSERRLFPWLVPGFNDKARSLSRFAFAGQGAADDVLFTTERPGHVVVDKVFTLQWDGGVKSMTCIVSNATSVATYEIDAAASSLRYRDFALGTGRYALVTVTNVVYDAAHEYTNGVWTAKNDCTTNDCTETSGVFVYRGTHENPVGCVASSRDVIGVGEGGCETFAEAKQRAREQGLKVISLEKDLVVTRGLQSGGFKDGGILSVVAGDDFILDLNGHTLQGLGNDYTILQTGGTLEIVDSAGGGAVLPPANGTVAVRCFRKDDATTPKLIVAAGRYDGEVCVTGRVDKTVMDKVYMPACEITGGSFTNLFDETERFYLDRYVTHPTAYFGLKDDYWQIVAEGFIWCGEGTNARWDNAANWRSRHVPHAGDLAIVPRTDGSVRIDFATGSDITEFVLDGDLYMMGTNNFSALKVVSGTGRLVGTGTACFTNAPPGKLTGAYDATGEIRLGADWRGTVRLSKITEARSFNDINAWGVSGSRLEMNGARGYVTARRNYSLPFELVLTDDGEARAWWNETGYTGGSVRFARLTGTGTFDSPKTLRDVMQAYYFDDVADFEGAFVIGGKRLVLGAGASAADSASGEITFADGVRVRTGEDNGWQAESARFGQVLYVTGETNDVLLTYAAAMPEVREVTVVRTGADGLEATNWLAAAGGKVVVVGGKPPASAKMKLGTKSVYVSEAVDAVRSGSTLAILPGSAVSIVGNNVLVNGKVVASVPSYYKLTKGDSGASDYTVSFDRAVSAPSLANVVVTDDGTRAIVTVTNAQPGLWYGLRAVVSLEEPLDEVEPVWKQAVGNTVTFDPEVSDSSSFYQVIVTDENPNGGVR